ncbi:DEKNAAC100572 [Brettanomyces naardenensis]|uniref:DEKNAAC100572 n=1 Tax=Brettanomyces naardenensis TaxID=13370 RepID=A0A448YFV2_BRENA|nr:DEKNAAC100572 [Brettanomyces naardenensis]
MPLEVWNILARTSNITVTSTTLKTNSDLLPAMKNATINLIVDQANGFEEILTLPNIANVAFDINSSPEDSVDTSVFGCNGIYQLQTEMFPLTEEHDVFRHVHSIAFCGTDSEDYKYVELIPKLTNLKSFKWKGLIQDPDILGLMLKLLPEDLKHATLEDVIFDNVNLREVCASSVKLVHCSFQMLASHDFAKNGFFNPHITALELVDCKFNLHRITLPNSLKALHIEYNRPAAYRFDLASMKSLEELSWDNYSITLPDTSLPSSLLHLKCNISSLEYTFPKNLITLDVDLQTAKKLHRLSFPECLRHLAIKARSSALNGADTNLVALHKLESFVFENKDSAAGSLRVPCQFTGPSTTPQIILTT